MTNKEYHAHSAISKSDIDVFLKSPKLFEMKKRGALPSADSKALLLGSVVHKLVLEPKDFDKEFVIEPNIDKRTKEGKAQYNEFLAKCEGKEIVPSDVFVTANNMAMRVLNDKTARKFIKNGFAERAFFSEFEGEQIKCKPDFYNEELGLIIDLKTSSDVSEFAKSVANFNYHIQAAIYSDILRANGLEVNGFLFVVVDKNTPYLIGLYELEDDAVELGRATYQRALSTIKELRKKGDFPECAKIATDEQGELKISRIQKIDLPSWVYNKGA